MSLAEILEEAASALPEEADAIRPANGDPFQLLAALDDDGARTLLTWVLGRDAEAATELTLAWVEDDRGLGIVGGIDEGALGKPGRKVLRRVRHHLRSQGVELPEATREPVVARLPSLDDDLTAAYVSAVDPRGARLVYLVLPNPSGGARLFEVMLDEGRGIVDFEIYAAGRSRIRKFVRDAVNRPRFPAVAASVDSVRALVHRIAGMHPSSRALPRQFGEWRSEVAREGATPGDQAREALADGVDAASLDLAAERVRKGSLGPWGPAPAELAELVQEKVEKQAEEPADESADAAFFASLTETIAGGDFAPAFASRFRESAYVAWKLDHDEDARACLAAAAAFEEKPASDNPVALAVVETLLSGALAGLRARAADEEGAADRDAAADGSTG